MNNAIAAYVQTIVAKQESVSKHVFASELDGEWLAILLAIIILVLCFTVKIR